MLKSARQLVNVPQSVADPGLMSHAPCGTLKCENASKYDKIAKREIISTLIVKIDDICERITLNVKFCYAFREPICHM